MKNFSIFIVIASLVIQFQALSPFGGNFKSASKSLNELDDASFFLEKLSFTSDVPFTEEEFNHLAGLETNTFITKKAVHKAYRNIASKKRFGVININLFDGKNGKHLEFQMEGQWILKKVCVSGFLFGKYEYGSLYLQQPGDVFDIASHEESLEIIKNHLSNLGYFDGKIDNVINYEQEHKTISVKLHISRGKKFSLVSTHFILDGKNSSDPVLQNVIQKTHNKFKQIFIRRPYDKEYLKKIAASLREFLLAEGFDHPRIKLRKETNYKEKTVVASFLITPGLRRIVTFQGNTALSHKDLEHAILTKEKPQWLFSPDIVCEQITHEYERRGIPETSVRCEKKDHVYNFIIKEGTPSLLEAIEVKNAETLALEDTSYFWQELLEKEIFDQDKLEDKIAAFKVLFQKNGYWDFTVVDQQTHLNELSGKYVVTLFIIKGPQRLWGGFTIKDHEELVQLPALKKFHPRNNRIIPFNKAWISEQKTILNDHFQKEGFWFSDLQPEITEVPAHDTDTKEPSVKKLCVMWKVTEGIQTTFGKVIIRGNTKLPFSHLKNEIKFQEGDVWDKEKIDLTRKKLKRLDVFKRVHVQPHQEGTKNRYSKPTIITLADDDPFELRFRFGVYAPSNSAFFKEEVTPKIGGSAIVKNPTNRADKFTFESDLDKFERKFNLEYQQPSLFTLPVLGKLKLYALKFTHPLHIASSKSAYQAHQTGGLLALSEEYKENYFWGINLGNEWVKTSKVTGNINFDPLLLDKTIGYTFIEPNVIIDHLDDKLNTTRGTFSFVSCKLMLPSKLAEYNVRLLAEQSAFYPIYDDIVLAGRLRLGHIFRKSFAQIMPIHRFYLGGPNSVRAYEKDSVPPIGISTRDKIVNGTMETITNYAIQGGGSMLNANLEVRFPFPGGIKKLQAVIFQDIGALSQTNFGGLKNDWYPATGFGLRIKTPIGPLRFDFGWKWKKRFPKDASYAWYLTLGEAF